MDKLATLVVLAILLSLNLSQTKPEKIHGKLESAETSSIFEPGKLPTVQLNKSTSGKTKIPLKIFTPTIAGTYSVLLFFHGTCLENSFYTSLFQFIASHGYIVVAPQLYSCTIFGGLIPVLPISGPDEVDIGAKVANWLPENLQSVLPTSVKSNLDKLALSGHSRGAKSAFAVALGRAETPLTVKLSALIGIAPVAGLSVKYLTDPKILTYVPDSFNLSIPVTVIGTGLGNQSVLAPFPACSPNGVNQEEFYRECKAPAAHFVARDYGHMDLLDDDLSGLLGFVAEHLCKNGEGSKDQMRRTVGGIVVSFLKACFDGNSEDFSRILDTPSVAPASLYTPQSKLLQSYAQI